MSEEVASYELDCVDCSFETTVSGGIAAVNEEIEKHRLDVNADPDEHVVNVRRRE